MKKTIFVGISLLSISICIDEVWGALTRSYSTGSIRREVNRQGSVSRYDNRGGVSRQRSIVSNSPNRRNSTGNMNIQAMTNRRPAESVKSFLESILIERSASDDLKKIIDEVPSEYIRILQRNIENFNIFLRGSRDGDAKNVANKLEKAIACLGELITTKEVICSELQYKTREDKNSSNSVVSLSGINNDLNKVNMKRLSEIISICEKERTLGIFTGTLKKFSNRINELKNILKEMNDTLSPVVLGQIEGNPGLKNLEFANTSENRRLGKIRDDNEAQNYFGEESFNDTLLSGQLFQEPEGMDEQESGGSVTPSYNASSSQGFSMQQLETQGNSVSTVHQPMSGTENNTNNATNSQPAPAQMGQQTVTGDNSGNTVPQPTLGTKNNTSNAINFPPTAVQQIVGQQGTESSVGNASVAQAASVLQNTGPQPVSDNFSQVSTQQPVNNAVTNVLVSQGDSSDNVTNSQLTSTQTGQQTVTEGNSGNAAPQPKVEQTLGESNTSTSTQVTPAQQSVELPTTASNFQVNTINKEDPKKFYALLETNIGSLKQEDLKDKKKIAYDKVREYLENAKYERSFKQRVSSVQRIINAYNSLATLIPKKLSTVPRQKIKSLREAIYSDVFDDLTLRMEKLKSNAGFENFKTDIDNFIKLNKRNKADFFDNSFFNAFHNEIKNNQNINFAKFLENKGKNTKSFEAITSDRKDRAGRSDQFSSALLYDDKKARAVIGIYKRGLMSSSVEEYDQLIRKIKKETGEKLDLVGPDLYDGVILSIDIN